MKLHLFLVLKINGVKKIARDGWPGFGMVTVGMDPNTFEVLNGHPNKIPTDKILGGVVQNCRDFFHWYPPKKLTYGKPRLGESMLT